MEYIIHDHQKEYYAAINASKSAGETTVSVEFMLSAIKASLIDVISMSDGVIDNATVRWKPFKNSDNSSEYHKRIQLTNYSPHI